MRTSQGKLTLRQASGVALLGASIVGLAACGSSNQSDISAAVAKANSVLASQSVGITLSCPTRVDTNSQFTCTYTDRATGKSATVKFHITGKNHDTLDVVDENAARAEVAKITGGG